MRFCVGVDNPSGQAHLSSYRGSRRITTTWIADGGNLRITLSTAALVGTRCHCGVRIAILSVLTAMASSLRHRAKQKTASCPARYVPFGTRQNIVVFPVCGSRANCYRLRRGEGAGGNPCGSGYGGACHVLDRKIPIVTMRMTQARRRILDELSRSTVRIYGAMTAREISEACGKHHRTPGWLRSNLRVMARHGLVRVVGTTLPNAHTWAITELGRAAIGIQAQRAGTNEPLWWRRVEAEWDAASVSDRPQRNPETERRH
jgi:hypothetical protein